MINPELNKLIGQRISSLRKKQGINLEQLAYQCGISKGGLSEIERNLKEPRVYTLLKICTGLNISLKDFFDFEEINCFQDSL